MVLLPTACEQEQQPPPPTAPGKLGDFPFCSFCLARIFDISQIEMCANLNCRCLLLGAIVSGIFQALEHANTETHTHTDTDAGTHIQRVARADTRTHTVAGCLASFRAWQISRIRHVGFGTGDNYRQRFVQFMRCIFSLPYLTIPNACRLHLQYRHRPHLTPATPAPSPSPSV